MPKAQTSSKYKGKLIVIDGVDGSGKGTQTKMLADRLKAEGVHFEIIDFPQYGQKSAGLAEEYLNGKYGKLGPYTSSIFYAVDRFDASFKIRSWLEAGKIVISNRYVTANAGHQGGKIPEKADRIKFFKWLEELEYGIFEIPQPDLNIILHVPARVAQKLVDKKSKDQRAYVSGKKRDLHEKDLKHLENAEKVFIELSEIYTNTKLIECAPQGKIETPEQIHAKVWATVKKLIAKAPAKSRS